MSDPVTRANAAQASFVVLVLLIVLVVLIRAPSDGVDRDSVPEVPGESVARTPAETGEPFVEPLRTPAQVDAEGLDLAALGVRREGKDARLPT